MTATKTLAALAAAGWTAAAGATLATRHWRSRHGVLRSLYWESLDERDELVTLMADLNDAASDGDIPVIPPGYASALHFASRPAHGKDYRMLAEMRRRALAAGTIFTVEDPKAGEWR